jgi:hypothetical protein
LNVSTEKGIAMNFPVPSKSNQCRDLLLKKEEQIEVFERNNPPMPDCAEEGYFVHARSQKPQKEETVTVYSEDFGSYGFLRSFANINKGGHDSIEGESPVYEPVPVPDALVKHPKGRKRITHLDNRVTVPRDVDENRIADNGWRSNGGTLASDPLDPRDDNDAQPAGDGYPGDGLSNYEEYRGFVVKGKHLRTDPGFDKDLFIFNPDNLNLVPFQRAIRDLQIHQIDLDEYVNNLRREINFNYNPKLHYVPPLIPNTPFQEPVRIQKGIFIVERTAGEESDVDGATFPEPDGVGKGGDPPNWIRRIEINTDVIAREARKIGIFPATLLIGLRAAHELGHSVNMYHHGDDVNVKGGLQSGNEDCIMRYDNIRPHLPEAVGENFCDHPAGIRYNSFVPCDPPACFGSASRGRGNCIHQIRISCRTLLYPVR